MLNLVGKGLVRKELLCVPPYLMIMADIIWNQKVGDFKSL